VLVGGFEFGCWIFAAISGAESFGSEGVGALSILGLQDGPTDGPTDGTTGSVRTVVFGLDGAAVFASSTVPISAFELVFRAFFLLVPTRAFEVSSFS
jgi:hypothetical protein